MNIRPAAVAGLFYPGDSTELDVSISSLLATGQVNGLSRPRALIVPHAGYIYSGVAAGRAYATLRAWAASYSQVVLIGPAHRKAIRGYAIASQDAFATPIGLVHISTRLRSDFVEKERCRIDDEAHAEQDSLEVQLPFLLKALKQFELLPLLVSGLSAETIAGDLAGFWDDDRTLIVVSTDLSHFHEYAEARRLDGESDAAIRSLQSAAIGPESACGAVALNGLLRLASLRQAEIERLALYNSGDIAAGDRSRVVGYASYHLT